MTMDRIKWEPVDLLRLRRIQMELSRQGSNSKSTHRDLDINTTSIDNVRPAATAQLAADLTDGLMRHSRSGSTDRIYPQSTANMEPSVRIEARCKNGHETYMYPKDCIKRDPIHEDTYIVWECARCPKDDFKCEVKL